MAVVFSWVQRKLQVQAERLAADIEARAGSPGRRPEPHLLSPQLQRPPQRPGRRQREPRPEYSVAYSASSSALQADVEAFIPTPRGVRRRSECTGPASILAS